MKAIQTMFEKSVKEFRQLFADFSIKVNHREFLKMDYPIWKSIKKDLYDYSCDNRKIEVYLTSMTYNDITVDLPYCGQSYKFNANDNSFGTYLWRYYTNNAIYERLISSSNIECPKEEKNIMKVNEEKKNMKFNFDFGPVKGDAVRMSPYGMAIKNSDNIFVAYDQTNETIVDVDVFNFDGSKFMYKMPVALKDVATGDVVIHNHVPMFVTDVNGNTLEVVDIFHGENKSIIPTTNMFGFNFVTKVVSFIDIGTPNKDNPFGNMLPFIMMSDKDADMKDVAMAMMFMNGNINLMQNPIMMLMLMDKDSNSDMLPFMMAMNMNKPVDKPIVTE